MASARLTPYWEYLDEYDALKRVGKHEEAQRALLAEAEEYIASHPDGPGIAQAKLNKALAIGWQGERRDRGHGELRDEEADEILQDIVSAYPDSPVAPAAMYYRARLYDLGFDRQRHQHVRALLLAVAERYPHSPEAPLALLEAAKLCHAAEATELRDRAQQLAIETMTRFPKRRVDERVFDHLLGAEDAAALEDGVSLCRELIDRGAETGYWRLAWNKLVDLTGALGDPKYFKETTASVLAMSDEPLKDGIGAELVGALALHAMRRPEDKGHADALVAQLISGKGPLTSAAAAAYYFLVEEKDKHARLYRQLAEDAKRLCCERIYCVAIRRQVELDRRRPRAERTDWNALSADLAERLPDYQPDAELLHRVHALYVENEGWGFVPEILQVLDELIALDPAAPNIGSLLYRRALAQLTDEYLLTGKYTDETRDELLRIAEEFPGTDVAVNALFELVYHHAIQGETEAAQAANLQLLSQNTPYARDCYRRNIRHVLQTEHKYYLFYRDAYYERLNALLPKCRFLNNAQKQQLIRLSHLDHVVEEPRQMLREIRERLLGMGEEELAQEVLLLEGQMLLMKWQYPEAVHVLGQASRVGTATARQVRDAERFQAAARFYLNDYETAGELLAQLETDRNDPDRPEHMLHLAMMKYEQGMVSDARALLASLIEEYPEGAVAEEAREILEYIKPLLAKTQ